METYPVQAPIRRTVLKTLLAAALPLGAGLPATAADDYPNHPIKLVVGYAPGGPTDVIARLVAQDMTASLGQTVIVENRAGANGNIGTESVARSPADGYTLIVNTLSHNVNPLLSPDKTKYDPAKDFTPINLAVVLPLVVIVGHDSPIKSMAELVAKAKADSGKVMYGSAGNGGSAHLAAALLEQRSGTKMTHVPYRGNAPALAEVMAGRIDFMFYPMIGVADLVASRQVRVIAITTAKRHPDFPNVPTTAEAGLPGFEDYVGPVGFLAPAATPRPVVAKLADAIHASIAKPATQDRLRQLGAVVVNYGPDDYRKWLREDAKRWAQLIEAAGVKGD
jgi:tripartite-type tricarboxylate transporter receptor subunit TctC